MDAKQEHKISPSVAKAQWDVRVAFLNGGNSFKIIHLRVTGVDRWITAGKTGSFTTDKWKIGKWVVFRWIWQKEIEFYFKYFVF